LATSVLTEPVAKRSAESDPAGELGRGRLPPGRHGLPPDVVIQSQRQRAINALAHTAAQRGYNETRIADIVRAASIARVTFYQQFGSKEQCFVAAFELVVEEARGRIAEVLRCTPEFPQRVVGSLRAVLELLSATPELARLCLIEAPAVGRPVGERYRHAIDRFVDLLRGCRPDTTSAGALPEATEAVLVNGIVAVIARRIDAGAATRLGELLPELSELALGPYLGASGAARFARRHGRPGGPVSAGQAASGRGTRSL
jgi:AcrR family transcriptional regulator